MRSSATFRQSGGISNLPLPACLLLLAAVFALAGCSSILPQVALDMRYTPPAASGSKKDRTILLLVADDRATARTGHNHGVLSPMLNRVSLRIADSSPLESDAKSTDLLSPARAVQAAMAARLAVLGYAVVLTEEEGAGAALRLGLSLLLFQVDFSEGSFCRADVVLTLTRLPEGQPVGARTVSPGLALPPRECAGGAAMSTAFIVPESGGQITAGGAALGDALTRSVNDLDIQACLR